MSTDVDTVYTDDQELTTRSGRMSAADIRLVLELHDAGQQQVEIARIVKCSQATVSRTLKAFNADSKAIARQLRTLTDETIEEWREAKQVAAKRGDHRPAKELIEMAYPELRPQPAAGSNSGATVVIVAVPGGDGNPLPSIKVSSSSTPEALSRALSPSVSLCKSLATDDI